MRHKSIFQLYLIILFVSYYNFTFSQENSGCDYNSFFSQIIKCIKNPSAGIEQKERCFEVKICDGQEEYFVGDMKYKKILVFYCQYGKSATVNGESCFDNLFPSFDNFLKTNGYSIRMWKNNSMPGWIKECFEASKVNSKFLFVFESESAASMGYSKITVIK